MRTSSLQTVFSNSVNGRGKNSSIFKDGAVYKGSVNEASQDKIKIILENGYEFQASNAAALKEGDKVSFLAAKQKDGSFMLKIIDQTSSSALDTEQTRELFKQSNFINDENMFEIKSSWENDSSYDKAKLAISRIQAKIAYASNNLTMAAVNELLASGISIQSLSLEMLNSVLQQVRESTEALTDSQLDEIIDFHMAELGIDSQAMEQKALQIKHLSENNLPVSEQNMDFLEKALKLFNECKELSDGAKAFLISLDKEIDLETLYKANYNSLQEAENADMALFDVEISKVFSAENIEETEKNLESARFLYKYQLPITKENLHKYEEIKNINKDVSMEKILDSAAKAIKDGAKIENTIITDFADKESLSHIYTEISESLHKITDNTIGFIRHKNLPFTLNNLRNAFVPENQEFKPDISSKLLIEEIRLRLTAEASSRLVSKGINIDTMPIVKAVEALRQAQNEVYATELQSSSVEATRRNVSAMEGIFSCLRSLRPLTNNVFSDIIEDEKPFTLSSVNLSKQAAKAIEQAEKYMAVPDKKYGDSFSKAISGLKDLLESMNIEATKENLRCAEIISKSGMELNEETLMQVKIINMKLEKIADTLHPKIAADMIKKGFDPLNAHVDEVLEYIDSFRGQFGEDIKDKTAEYIFELDSKNELSQNQRNALIAMYKLINNIEKNNGAIGLNLMAGRTPTFNNLLSASLHSNSEPNIESEISEGSLESVTRRSSIRSRLGEAIVSPATSADFTKMVVKNFMENMNYENGLKLINSPEMWDLPIDELMDFLSENADSSNIDALKSQQIYEDISDILSKDPKVFEFLESVGLPATFSNIRTYLEISKPSFFSEKLRNISAETGENALSVNLEEIEITSENEPMESLQNTADKAEEAVMDSRKLNLLREIRLLQNGVKVQNAISKRQNSYSIPVNISGEIGQLNMYIPSGFIPRENQVNLALSLEVKDSAIEAFCEIDKQNIRINLKSDSLEISDSDLEILSKSLEEYGFSANGINLDQGLVNGNIPLESYKMYPDNKENMFNLAKAVMKFADIITK